MSKIQNRRPRFRDLRFIISNLFRISNFEFRIFYKGFTLVEMMVAVGIFAIIMMIAVGGFLSLMQANYKAQSTKVVVNNLHFAFENMARNLRTGSSYHCDININTETEPWDKPRNCSTGASSISFKTKDGNLMVYKLNNKAIERLNNDGQTFTPLTSSEIEVTELLFFVANSLFDDNRQPIVRILANGFMKGKGKVESKFTIETAVSQRLLDI